MSFTQVSQGDHVQLNYEGNISKSNNCPLGKSEIPAVAVNWSSTVYCYFMGQYSWLRVWKRPCLSTTTEKQVCSDGISLPERLYIYWAGWINYRLNQCKFCFIQADFTHPVGKRGNLWCPSPTLSSVHCQLSYCRISWSKELTSTLSHVCIWAGLLQRGFQRWTGGRKHMDW